MLFKSAFLMVLIWSTFAGIVKGKTTSTATDVATSSAMMTWGELPPVPDPLGRGGPFAGVSGGALLVAGGTNWPAGMPWQNGIKAWHHDVMVLPEDGQQWKQGFQLPQGAPSAYGVSATSDGSVICAGGANADGHSTFVLSLSWDGKNVKYQPLPSLPVPIAYGGGAIVGDVFYIVGGITETSSSSALSSLYCLDLKNIRNGWKSLEPLPGESRILPAVAVVDGCLFVFAGSHLSPGPNDAIQRKYMKDAWKYKPGTGWARLADMPRGAVAAPAIVTGAAGNTIILVPGGDDGANTGFDPPESHPGFTHQVLAYDTGTNAWSDVGVAPFSTLTSPAVKWKNGIAIINGEIKPGVRTPKIFVGVTSR